MPTLSDYYNYCAFGMLQPGNYGRGNAAAQGGYRYGHNGQEHGDELGLNHYTAQHWEYDARLGRRWNLDPEPQRVRRLATAGARPFPSCILR